MAPEYEVPDLMDMTIPGTNEEETYALYRPVLIQPKQWVEFFREGIARGLVHDPRQSSADGTEWSWECSLHTHKSILVAGNILN